MLYAIMVYDTILYGNGLSTALFNQIRRLRGVKPSEASVCDINETVGNLICAPISSPNYRKILPLFGISGHNLAPCEGLTAQEETKRKLRPFAGEIKRYGMEYFAGNHLWEEEIRDTLDFLYVLYNFWYREVEDTILAKPAVTDYLGKVATELSRQFSNVLTLNFDCLLDNKHMTPPLDIQHLHGRFVEGLQNYGEVQFFSYDEGKSFEYTYLFGSNALEKGNRLKKIHDYFQSSPPKYYDLDFLFGDGKDWGNLLVYGVSFLPTAVFPEEFFRCFPEDKGVPGEPDYYFVNSLDGHILFRIQKLLELGMIKHVTIACYSEDNRKLYEELLSQTPIAKNLTLCPCKDVPFSPGLKRLIGT